jgi:2-hydroxychromene-2-carboxylate isomerase
VKPTLDIYFLLASPWTYLGWRRSFDIAQKYKVNTRLFPIDFGTVFKATGGLPLAQRPPARQAYRLVDLQRWKDHYSARDFNLHPAYFPTDHTKAALLAIAARRQGENIAGFCYEVLRGLWCENKDITDQAFLKALIQKQPWNAGKLMEAVQDPAVAEEYAADTQTAITLGVFGAPSYVINGEVFWGQDRLDFVDQKLAGLAKI